MLEQENKWLVAKLSVDTQVLQNIARETSKQWLLKKDCVQMKHLRDDFRLWS
jgi:hypothetical protein